VKLKTDPSYATIKYYYQDKTSSDTFLYKKDYRNAMLLGSIIITEDGRVYFTASGGGKPISVPEKLSDDGIYPYDWMNISEIEYCINYQPYDFDEWWKGHAMYSKTFWRLLVSDMREAKIRFINEDLKNLKWIHADQ
jgi:hypothetical protein